MPLAWLLPHFQSLPQLPTSKLSPSGAESQVGELVYVLGHHGLLQQTLLWDWKFLLPPQPTKFFRARSFEAFFSPTGIMGCVVTLTLHRNMGLPGPSVATLLHVLSTAAAELHPFYQSGWICIFFSSLVIGLPCIFIFWQFWLFFVFKFVVICFWLCKEEKLIYLCLHLGQKIMISFVTQISFWSKIEMQYL